MGRCHGLDSTERRQYGGRCSDLRPDRGRERLRHAGHAAAEAEPVPQLYHAIVHPTRWVHRGV